MGLFGLGKKHKNAGDDLNSLETMHEFARVMSARDFDAMDAAGKKNIRCRKCGKKFRMDKNLKKSQLVEKHFAPTCPCCGTEQCTFALLVWKD